MDFSMNKNFRGRSEAELAGLKFVITLLPGMLLLFYWHRHPSIALSTGLIIGIILGQLIPPRKPAWQVSVYVAMAIAVGIASYMLFY